MARPSASPTRPPSSRKSATAGSIGTCPYLIFGGVIVTAGVGDVTPSEASGCYAVLFGLLRATGIGSIAVAIGRYDGHISQLAPSYNMNTLVAVVGLIALGEWKAVLPGRLLPATALIFGGGVLAATSAREAAFERLTVREPHRLQ